MPSSVRSCARNYGKWCLRRTHHNTLEQTVMLFYAFIIYGIFTQAKLIQTLENYYTLECTKPDLNILVHVHSII